MSFLPQPQNDPAALLSNLQLGLNLDETTALGLLSSITTPTPNPNTNSILTPTLSFDGTTPTAALTPNLLELMPNSTPISAPLTQSLPLETQGCAFPGSNSPVSHVDANVVQQLMQVQQAAGMQQLVVNMLAQYQQTQVAAQTQAMLSLLIPMVNLQQPQTQTAGNGKPVQKESGGSKKDPKEKYKKPGNKQYKTEMCKTFEETGSCRYGKKCQFAHGGEDMRDSPKHPKFKTIPCETIVNGGSCPYGRRCRFIHPQDDQVEAGMFSCKVNEQVAHERRLPVFEELAPSQSSASSCGGDSEQA
eukprot:TRINITY_DN8819_c0_g1_i3.p1 TRINITY_DN8819_c0_g1~~TRINITY_DN8819_c0_g1_i3.p1  ORF type:complete len:303 (+),score=37.86 TRINITY_DN8819_c0_g1_i3:120-1028(+)